MQVRWCARGLVVLAVAASTLAAAAAPARADGDPASDVLLYQSAFFPYAAPSSSAKSGLLSAVAAARKAGFPVRVAVIQAKQDLGADPELYGTPQLYARFLDSELLSANYLGVLIVVMPQGLGIAGGGKLVDHGKTFKPRPIGKLQAALAQVPPPHTTDPDTLTATGIAAVRAVAKAAGHPIPGKIPTVKVPSNPTTQGAPGSSGRSATTLFLGAGLAVLALAAVFIIGFGVRRSRPSEPPL
jgi:hypothetical protein